MISSRLHPDLPRTQALRTHAPPASRLTRGLLVALVVAVGLAPLAPPAHAQIPEGVEGTFRPHPEADKAISRLLSPFCPGFMLSQCPAAESLALRDSIQALALTGWNAEALEAWMLSRHGEEYRAVPKRSGAGLLAWILPPLALLLGLGGVGVALRRFLGPRPGAAGGATGSDSAGSSGEPGHALANGSARTGGQPAGRMAGPVAGQGAAEGAAEGAGVTAAMAAAGSGPRDLPSQEEEARLREALRDLEFSEDPVY
jgi:cytochrome c-type biogenesis protein CcmH/NrfF